jgi:hypothetical protein
VLVSVRYFGKMMHLNNVPGVVIGFTAFSSSSRLTLSRDVVERRWEVR